MALETVAHITDLVITNPTSSDAKSQGDDHIRNLKIALKADFANITAPVTVTHTEINALANVTTAGTGASMYVVTQSPGNNSKYAASTAYVDAAAFATALPAQTGNSGKLVTTNGTAASWSLIGSAGQYLRVNAGGTALEGAAPIVAWIRKTTTYTAVSSDRIKASTTAAAWSLTFPAAPADGDEIEIQDVDGTFHTNNLTLLVNGKKIMGFTTSWVLDTRYAHLVFVYDSTLGDWRI